MAEKREVIVEETPKQEKEELSNVTVNLDKPAEELKKVEEKKIEESKYITADQLSASLDQAIKKATAPLYYEIRRGRQDLAQPIQSPKQETPDEWDVKLQKDWKATVDERARLQFQEMARQQSIANQVEYERQRNLQLLEENKRKVLERHKELNDETSSKADVYRGVLQEHPEYIMNPFGPVLAMRDMEDKLRDRGELDESTRQVVQKEVIRQTRAGAGVIPKGTPPSKQNSITLTREQKELCDANGWKYEKYAKYANMLKSNQGVEA